MKRVLVLYIAFLTCFCSLDYIFGYLARPLLLNEPDAGNNHSNLKQSLFNKRADLLVFGASKSNHHYISDTLQHHFKVSVCNSGIDGDNIVTSYIQFESMLERHIPQMVILDLSGGQLAGDWKNVILTHKCYYGVHAIYSNTMNELLPICDRLNLFSSFYRLNEELPDLIQSYIVGDRNNNGFIPLIGSAPNMSHIVKGDKKKEYKIEDVQKKYLSQIIDRCHNLGIELYAVYSPSLISYDNNISQVIGRYCEEKGVTFFNYEGNYNYVKHPELFKDYNHLNIQGARRFTRDIIIRIMSERNKSNIEL